MKKEWIYFIAGASTGLMAAVIFFSMPNYADPEECFIREATNLKSIADEFYYDIKRYCDRF